MQLTDAGQLLLRYAERLLALSTDAITATRDVQEVRTGSIYLAASQTTGVYLLPRLIGVKALPHPADSDSGSPKVRALLMVSPDPSGIAGVVHASGLAYVSHS